MAVLLQEGLALSSRTTTTTTPITTFSSCCKFSSSLRHGIIRAPGVFVASKTGSSTRKLVVEASSGSGASKVKNSRRYNITLLPGDGIGPEIMRVAVDVLKAVGTLEGIQFEFTEKLVGGAAIDAVGDPLPEDTLKSCKESDSVLLAAIGGYKWDKNPRELKPETGLLKLRAGLGVFANFRPATVFPQLVDASPLKNEIADSVDIMVVRELIGGWTFFTFNKDLNVYHDWHSQACLYTVLA
jgi:hypothetical protein